MMDFGVENCRHPSRPEWHPNLSQGFVVHCGKGKDCKEIWFFGVAAKATEMVKITNSEERSNTTTTPPPLASVKYPTPPPKK